MPGGRTQRDCCSHLGLFGLPSIKTTPKRLKVRNPGLIRQMKEIILYFLQAVWAHSAYPPCHPPLHCQWKPGEHDKNKIKGQKMARDGLKWMVWAIILQRALQYCESNSSGCISSNNQNKNGWFLAKLSRGLTLLTHLFILLRLLLILKLLVKSNRKGFSFFLTGLVFKNEHIKFMSQNWDSSRESRVVESEN